MSSQPLDKPGKEPIKSEWKVWNQFLFDLYKNGRLFPGWADLFECHDEEDQAYFWMLENEMEAGKLICMKPPKS